MEKKKKKLLEEKRKQYKNENKDAWLTMKNETFAKFASSICDWPNQEPRKASEGIKRALRLQKERIKKNGLEMKIKLETSPKELETSPYLSNKKSISGNYENKTEYKYGHKTIEYYRDGKLIKKYKTPFTIYANIINTTTNDILHDTYNCPNCSSPVKIEELTKGCPYCHTKFLVSDIYPVVNNYYDIYRTSIQDIKPKRIILLLAIITTILYFIVHYSSVGLSIELLLSTIIYFIFFGVIAMTILVYAFLAFAIIIEGISKNSKNAPLSTYKTPKQIENLLQKYDKNFTFKYFEGEIVNLLKRIVYADNPSKLSIYTGNNNIDFSNVINTEYKGGMKLIRSYQENNKIYLDLIVYMLDTYIEDGIIKDCKHQYKMTVYKNINAKQNFNFSVEKIACSGCGASFDGESISECPYCGQHFELSDYDFTIGEIE